MLYLSEPPCTFLFTNFDVDILHGESADASGGESRFVCSVEFWNQVRWELGDGSESSAGKLSVEGIAWGFDPLRRLE